MDGATIERETEREKDRKRKRRSYKKVGWTRRECRLTDASVARNGESCLPPREVYATRATVHLLSLNSRNFARGSCTMPTITYAPPPLIHSSPSLRSSMRASLFHSLQTFSRFTFAEGSTVHRVCTLFPRGGIPCRWILYLPPTFRYLIFPPIYLFLSRFSFFLSSFFFFFLFAKNKEKYSAFVFRTRLWSFGQRLADIVHELLSPSRVKSSRRLCERFNLFSRHGGKRLGKGKVFNSSLFFFFFLAFYHLYS